MGLEMQFFWTKGGENRTLFADMVPGRPRVPRKTSQSEVLGAFWAHILYVFVSIQCHISKIFQRFAGAVFCMFVVCCFAFFVLKAKGKGKEKEGNGKG